MNSKLCRCSRRARMSSGSIVVVLLPAMLAAGCAHQTQYQEPSYNAGGPRPVAAKPVAEMEDDGRPGQLPPRAEARQVRDDPTQPWSPNYGGPAQKPLRAQAPQTAPVAQPVTARRVAMATDPR